MNLSPSRNSLESPLNPESEMDYNIVEEEAFQDETTNNEENSHDPVVAAATAPSESWWNPQQLSAMLSNFSTSYNVVNISLVLPILESLRSASQKAVASSGSSLLAGMMLGQVVGGALGDTFLGALGALRLVMILQIVASIGSACINVQNSDFYVDLATWRFILGIGAGGVYPLAAVLSAEQGKANHDQGQNEEESGKQVHRVVLTFSTQGLGFVAVPILAVILFRVTDDLNFIWRFMLGFGCVPGLLLMLLQCKMYRQRQQHSNHEPVQLSEEHTEEAEVSNDEELDVSPEGEAIVDEPENEAVEGAHGLAAFFHEPGLGKKIVGTAGTWFLFDIVFYGNTIFQPIVMEAAFGSDSDSNSEELSSTARKSLVLTSMALPGYFFAAMVMGKKTLCVTQTPRYVMMQGFAAMATLYAVIGINWSYLRHYPAILITLYGMTFFFANYGPNTTTFILPSLLYSPEHRSTWNGISAACGKLGALVGASMFAPLASSLGNNVVMLLCAGLSVLGFFLTSCFVPSV